jgi:PAS domain S-box-containing protein
MAGARVALSTAVGNGPCACPYAFVNATGPAMPMRPNKPWWPYVVAVVTTLAAAFVTQNIHILRERFTLFLFWPLLLALAWYGGAGPALLAAALAAAYVLTLGSELPDWLELLPLVGAVTVATLTTAVVAYWRRDSESKLHEASERFSTVANSAPVLIGMSGADKGVTYFNSAWLEFTGRPLTQELGMGWLAGVHPDDRDAALAKYEEAWDARRPFEVEFRLRRADGEYRSVLVRGRPRLGEDGQLAGYTASATDITDQRDAISAADDARKAAEAASRAKDAFLATVSHELRAPLSPILTWARMLRNDHLDPTQSAKALEVIERNARLQAQLIEDLLDVARIVEGKVRLQVRPVDLSEVVENAVDTVRPAAEAKDVRLQLVLDSTITLPGDPERLQQVVWNLLSNAVKFTPKGGRIHIVLERVNSHIEIAVSDTGAGIAPDQVSRLFERFWQADSSTTRVHTGLGLGLSIVRHLTELHGGTVTAESPGVGQGSTFTVKLPLAPMVRTADELTRRHPTLQHAVVPNARLDGVRVLLVDDEPDSNEAVRMLLDHCGAEVRVAGSAAHAYEILFRWKPDVLLTDIGMPGEDGYSLLARIRKQQGERGQVPAIALTAFASPDDRARLLSAGFRLHLAKPVEPGELTTAIAAVVGDAHRRAQ